MRVTDNSNYGDYIKNRLDDYSRHLNSYLYIGLVITALGLYWYNYGMVMMLEFFTTIATGLTITIFLTECLMALLFKEFRRNKFISYSLLLILLTIITLVFFDMRIIYWSLAGGILFVIPLLILSARKARLKKEKVGIRN